MGFKTNLLLVHFLLLFYGGLFSQINERINPTILNAVVRIQNKGTGFIIASPQFDGTNKYFLITNKHLLGYWTPGEEFVPDSHRTILVYFEDTLGQQRTLPYPTLKIIINGSLNPDVRLHPNPKIDVAAIELKSMARILKSDGCLTSYFNQSLLVPIDSIRTKTNCDIGSTIYAIGYPGGKSSIPGGKPILKSGTIATELLASNKYEWRYEKRDSSEHTIESSDKIFIVDAPLYKGNSGSPIVVPLNNYTTVLGNRTNYIIGIVSSGNLEENIAFVFAADFILELIK